MKELLKQLAQARQYEELTKKAKQDSIAEFEASPFFQALQVNHANAVARTNELTETLRKKAENQYHIDQDKKPGHGGYEIKMSTSVVLKEETKLRDWLFNNFRPALKVDTKVVEKAAKDGTIPAEFAEVKEEPKVYIKSDLSKFIE